MLYIIYLLIFIAALAELLWFGGSTAWSVSVMLLCVAFVAAKFILRNKMPKKLQTQFLIVGIAVAAVLIVQIGLSGNKGGIMDYGDRLAKVIAYLEEEEYKDAAKELEDMQEIFGDSDAAYILSAVRTLETGDVLAAQEDYRNIKNRSQRLYYSLGEQIYKAEDTEQNREYYRVDKQYHRCGGSNTLAALELIIDRENVTDHTERACEVSTVKTEKDRADDNRNELLCDIAEQSPDRAVLAVNAEHIGKTSVAASERADILLELISRNNNSRIKRAEKIGQDNAKRPHNYC